MAISVEKNKDYWNKFYKQDFVHIPSQFCALVATSIEPNSTVVELGCGNGRDSHFFSEANFNVVGIDLSQGAIDACNKSSNPNRNIQFLCGDISDEATCDRVRLVMNLSEACEQINFYSRFVIHSIDEQQEKSFMMGLKTLMSSGDHIFFEFRSQDDQETKKVYGNHYRRYINTELFTKNLVDIVGVDILYSITGRGMAMYKDEDPSVSRIIAQKL